MGVAVVAPIVFAMSIFLVVAQWLVCCDRCIAAAKVWLPWFACLAVAVALWLPQRGVRCCGIRTVVVMLWLLHCRCGVGVPWTSVRRYHDVDVGFVQSS